MQINAADLFAGAGGTSTGLALACQEIHATPSLLAVNHWPVAIESHRANHPWARHLCKSLHEVDPRKEIAGRKLDILTASPECTHHSIARGGRPMSDQLRASAWLIVDWLSQLSVNSLLIENVREFRDWGPLGSNGRPIKSRKGETYRAFLSAVNSMGYRVEDRVLNAADYGAATTRQRLFILARRGNKRITWPEPSHSIAGLTHPRWRAAREIIDWSLPSQSIFTRKQPLAKTTLKRIAAGLKRFSGVDASFEPFLLPHQQFTEKNGLMVDSIDRPLRTITAHNGRDAHLVEPFLIPFYGERPTQDPRSHSIHDPLPTVTGHGAGALVEPFLVQVNHGENRNNGRGNSARVRSLTQPLPTITAGANGLGLVEPFLIKYYSTGIARSVDEPIDTITTKDRYALVVVIRDKKYILDIRLRMLQPHELAAGMGFPKDYLLRGTRAEQVKQIGNAVEVNQALALCRSLLT